MSKTRRNRRQSRKSRRRQRGGGKLDALPIGGATPAEQLTDLQTRWDIKLIMGHGQIIPGLAQVPADTYVLFNSPAGCRAIAEGGVPYPDVVIGDDRDEFLNKLVAAHNTRSGILDTTTADVRAALDIDACYNPEFFTDETFWRLSTKSGKLSNVQRKRTIYGPGEQVNEMSIAFINNMYEFLVLGVYNLPISRGFYEGKYYSALGVLRTDEASMYQHFASQSKAVQAKLLESAKGKTRELDLTTFTRDSPNLQPLYIGFTKKLSEVFAELPPVPAGQVRLLFIGACRGVQCALPTPDVEEAMTRLARRGSLEGDPGGSSYALASVKRVVNAAIAANNASKRASTGPSIGVSSNVAGVIEQMRKLNNRSTPPGQLAPLRKALRNLQASKPNLYKEAKAAYNAERASGGAGAAGGP